ncbi:MAG: hypothetical protein NWQ19_03150 [Nonlabens sp.]|nr:hypothetical protein [Nonlabens sp.]
MYKYILILLLSCTDSQAQNDGYQKMDWDNAPVNPVGFYNHKSHYKLKGDVIMSDEFYFNEQGMLLRFNANTYAYDANNRIIATEKEQTIQYTKQGLVEKVAYKSGKKPELYGYDEYGNLIKKVNEFVVATYDYDEQNRVIIASEQYENSTRSTVYSYKNVDGGTEVTSTSQFYGKETTFVGFYYKGHQIKTKTADGTWESTGLVLDNKGNVVKKDSNGNVTQFLYKSAQPIMIKNLTATMGMFSIDVKVNGVPNRNVVITNVIYGTIIYVPQNDAYYFLTTDQFNSGAQATFIGKTSVVVLNRKGYFILDNGLRSYASTSVNGVLGNYYYFYDNTGANFNYYKAASSTIANALEQAVIPVLKMEFKSDILYSKTPNGNIKILDKGVFIDNSYYSLRTKNGVSMAIPVNSDLPLYTLTNIDKATIGEWYEATSDKQILQQADKLKREILTDVNMSEIFELMDEFIVKEIKEDNQKTYAYYGQWQAGDRNGYGKYTWKDTGNFTIGYWEKGLREGLHIKRAANGTIQEAGMYVKDKLLSNQKWKTTTATTTGCLGDCTNGFGQLKTPNGHLYIGFFKNGKLDGIAIMVNENGSQYEGEVKNGLRHGYGDWYAKNSQVYHGNFENDRTNGYGILIEKDGTVKKGIFKDDKLVTAM